MSSSYSLKIILLDSRGYHSLLLYANEQIGQSPERHGSTNDEKTIPKIITSLPVQIQSKNDAQLIRSPEHLLYFGDMRCIMVRGNSIVV